MEGKRLLLGFDVDGVLAAFSPAYIEIANRIFGLALKPEDQTGWAHQSLGLTDAQSDQVWDEINATENWWLHLPKMPGTASLIDAVMRHRLYFITHRSPTKVGMPIEEQTAYWLRREFHIPNPTVITCKKKGEVADGLELNAFIDDKPANCKDIVVNAPFCDVFLQDAPYNKEFECYRVRRVKDVNDFIVSVERGLYGIREVA